MAQTATSSDALPSWNEGPARQAILDFVRDTTDQANLKFVPPEERIATFDQDGTLWVEHPVYSQMMYCLDRVPALAAKKPALKNVEPFKTILSGNREAIAKLPMRDLKKIIVATLTGMTNEEFEAEVKKCLSVTSTSGVGTAAPSAHVTNATILCGTDKSRPLPASRASAPSVG